MRHGILYRAAPVLELQTIILIGKVMNIFGIPFSLGDLPEGAQEEFRKKQEQEKRNQIKGADHVALFKNWIREADPKLIEMFVTQMYGSHSIENHFYFTIGMITAVMQDRGICPSCFRPEVECAGDKNREC